MASSRLLCRSYITKRSDRNVTFILMQAMNHTQLLLFSLSTIANAKESTNQWCLWLRLDFADLYLLYKWISFMLITVLQLRNPSTNGSNDQHTLWNWFVLKEVSPSKRHRTTIPGFSRHNVSITMLYDIIPIAQQVAIALCFVNQAFLYEHGYDPITWGIVAYKAYIKIHISAFTSSYS